jgi:predicted RND superfamily exporter protein
MVGMTAFFQRRDRWGQGWALWVLAGLAFLAPLAGWALRGLRLDSDVQGWLPAHDREAKIFAWMQEHFVEEQRVIVAWEGSTLNDPRIERFAEALRGPVGDDGVRRNGVPFVSTVYTPGDAVDRMVALGVEQDEALRRLEGVLIGTGWMKVRLTASGQADEQRSIREVVEHVESRLGIKVTVHDRVTDWIDEAYLAEVDADAALGVESPETPSLMIPEHDFQVQGLGLVPESELASEFRKLATEYRGFATADEPHGRQLVDDCFFAVGTPVAIVIGLSDAGGAEPARTLSAIRHAAVQCGIPEETLHIGGRAVTSAELGHSIQRAAWNPDVPLAQFHRRSILLASGLVGLVLAFVFLRSIRLGVLVVGTSWYATALSIGLIPLTGGQMNMVLVVMPTLLMVLALSAAIHVANYWRHSAHENPATAVSSAFGRAWTPCVMASLTTAIGFASLCTSSLAPVRDFGIYSAIGCIITLAVVLYGLPALLKVWPAGRPAARDIDAVGWKWFGMLLYRRSRLVTAVCLTVCLIAALGFQNFRTETKVIRYFADDSALVQDYQFLEENLSGITPVEIIVRFDQPMQERSKFLERLEIVREVVQSVRQHPEISGALSLAEFQPVSARPARDSGRAEMLRYLRKSQAVEIAVKSGEQAGCESMFVVAEEAGDLLVEGDAELNQAGDELWRISAQASVLSDVNYGDLTAEINSRVQAVTRFYPGTSHVVTGTVPLFLRTQEALLSSLIISFVMAFAIIGAIMVWVLKDFWAGLLSMIPNLLPVVFVFGCLSASGARVDVATMITASVALGIAVDGTLHLLTWFQHGLERGNSRFRATIDALADCAPAMWQTSIAICVGLLMLYPADLLLISRFGWLMSALIFTALVGDLVLLPALLAGPLGALIERRVRQRLANRPALSTTPAEAVPSVPAPHIPLPAVRHRTRSRSVG